MNEISQDSWEVFNYEVSMFRGLYEYLTPACKELFDRFPLTIKNVITEDALFHYRQLVEILISSGKQQDDILLCKLLPGFTSLKISELEAVYGKSNVCQ